VLRERLLEMPERFQIHLSTAIVMMFMAGVLIWANVRSQIMFFNKHLEAGIQSADAVFEYRGWPYTVWNSLVDKDNLRYEGVVRRYGPASITYKNAGKNAALAIATLFAVGFLSEWLIHRRASRKGA
jgi:hypothetical protein